LRIKIYNTTQNSSDNLSSYLPTTIIAQTLSIEGKRVHYPHHHNY